MSSFRIRSNLQSKPGKLIQPRPGQATPNKIAWFYSVLFVRIRTYQWVTAIPNKNSSPRRSPCSFVSVYCDNVGRILIFAKRESNNRRVATSPCRGRRPRPPARRSVHCKIHHSASFDFPEAIVSKNPTTEPAIDVEPAPLALIDGSAPSGLDFPISTRTPRSLPETDRGAAAQTNSPCFPVKPRPSLPDDPRIAALLHSSQ